MSPGGGAAAAIVAIGDELVTGAGRDSNSAAIAGELLQRGIETERFVVIGDDEAALERLFRELCAAHRIVVCTGGLGPTLDDVTRSAAAGATGLPLELDAAVLAALECWFADRGRAMAAANRRQALFPRGARVLPNPRGTAPGFRVEIAGGTLVALPGPPREMRAMLAEEVLPWIDRTSEQDQALAFAGFHLIGLGESDFADAVGAWMQRDANPRMGVTSSAGVLSVTLRARSDTGDAARELLDQRCAEFRERLGSFVFSEEDPRPALALGQELIRRGTRLALAESCTGGLVAEMLTRVPGISAVFLEGLVTYSNQAKTARLGVPTELLERCGAVSPEVAEAMVRGLARSSGADLALSLTGIAGPGGGSPTKPVGLVWFGVFADGEVFTESRRLPPVDRETVRRFAAHAALELLRRGVAGEWGRRSPGN